LFYNNIPYAKVHNEGFSGLVNIPKHIRVKFEKTAIYNVKSHRPRAIKVRVGEGDVQGHTRHANIIQRQFAPTNESLSPILAAEITEWLEKDIKAILTL